MAKLICENDISNANDISMVVEQQNDKSPRFLKIKGPFISCNKKNENGRIYSKPLMTKVIEDYQKEISGGRAFGELNHPPTCSIDMSNLAIRITSLKNDGDIFLGEAIVLCTPPDRSYVGTKAGDVVGALLHTGCKIGVSTRGVGEINENNVIDTSYNLVAIDVVHSPSIGMFVNGILESKEFLISNHGDIMEIPISALEKGLATIPTHSTKTDLGKVYVESLIENFLNSIGK